MATQPRRWRRVVLPAAVVVATCVCIVTLGTVASEVNREAAAAASAGHAAGAQHALVSTGAPRPRTHPGPAVEAASLPHNSTKPKSSSVPPPRHSAAATGDTPPASKCADIHPAGTQPSRPVALALDVDAVNVSRYTRAVLASASDELWDDCVCQSGRLLAPAIRAHAPHSQCSKTRRRIAGFLHIGALGKSSDSSQHKWPKVARELVQRIDSSRMMACVEAVHVGVVGRVDMLAAKLAWVLGDNPKVRVDVASTNAANFEMGTLQLVHDYCAAAPEALVFYIHTKGTWSSGTGADKWRKHMSFHVLESGKSCIAQLERHGKTVCGMRWTNHPAAEFGYHM